MIERISLANVNQNGYQPSVKKANLNGSVQSTSMELSKADVLQGLKSSITFNGAKQPYISALGENENKYVNLGKGEIVIPDVLNLDTDLKFPKRAHPSFEKINEHGLYFDNLADGELEFSTSDGKQIFYAAFDKGSEMPKVTYSQGKYSPEILIEDEKTGAKIRMFAGSIIEGESFKFVMPGHAKNFVKGQTEFIGNGNVAFKGHVAITTLNMEDKTKNAVELYLNSPLQGARTKGAYEDLFKDNDVNIAIPAGGFGTRFYNITREDENKPSAKLPTMDNYRVMATALNMAASTQNLSKDSITYVSQNPGAESANLIRVKKYDTDGGAIYEAIKNGTIDENKDLIILNSDIISNADISRAYKALKDLPNAAFVIPYYPVDATRAKSFGLMSINIDDFGNKQIVGFVEKPGHTVKAPTPDNFAAQYEVFGEAMADYDMAQKAKIDETNMFHGNPGIYILSKDAVKAFRILGDRTDGVKTGLGKNVMPHIVDLCNEGKLIDDNGEKMHPYTVQLSRPDGKPAFWDDIGSASAYMDVIRNIAKETEDKGTYRSNFYYGLPNSVLKDFKSNVDLEKGIVFMNDDAKFDYYSFYHRYGLTPDSIKGNILIG